MPKNESALIPHRRHRSLERLHWHVKVRKENYIKSKQIKDKYRDIDISWLSDSRKQIKDQLVER